MNETKTINVFTETGLMRTYIANDCIIFCKTKEHFGGLSNMAGGLPLIINNITIRTSEALYQACRYPHMPEVQRLIIEERSPMTAKMRTRKFRKESREDWLRVRVSIMRWCLRVKLLQNWDSFSNLLLETEDHPIVEKSSKDIFWGAREVENGTLLGGNVLGRLLMELREEIKTLRFTRNMELSPPGISSFLLLQNSINSINVQTVGNNVHLISSSADGCEQLTLDLNWK